ncbi:glycosyltransferase [Turicibacter sanguinis]|uniref:glycosyltransferase n=1 Tax=Turicibacter sanguinis TaxID=154288 RepID=UPI0021D4B087|nr:glycosyltransferase [Turicibacter sanguinis]MCU7197749.1 glycosyltransferase [Turicibacter sanguinis]
MKIVHLVESFGGGVYSFLKDLCNSQALDDEVIVVYSKREQTPDNFQDDFNKNVKLINIQMKREINVQQDLISLFKVYNVLKEVSPDIIHLHSSKAGVLGRIAASLLNYNHKAVFYNPHGYGFLQQNISKLKRYMYFYIEKIVANINGTIIAVSKGEYEESKKLTNRVLRIDNAINTDDLNKLIKDKVKTKDIKIGTIGRISHQKNPQLFNEIAKRFSQYEFIWIGDGDLKHELNSPNISVTGWLNRESAVELLNSVDIYIQTSLWEGLPIALLEAMYMQKPVLVTNVIGNKDVIENNINGFICTNIEEFYYSINLLLGNSDLYNEVAQNAFNFILENHSLRKMVEKYNKAYTGQEQC